MPGCPFISSISGDPVCSMACFTPQFGGTGLASPAYQAFFQGLAVKRKEGMIISFER
jgi:hypothetical protein